MSTENQTVKQKRADHCNQAIRIIGDHGRRFFYNANRNTYARLEVDARGKVWFVDDYSGIRIYTHPTGFGGRWRGFSHGGTLRDLVKSFREYISTGTPINPYYLGQDRLNIENGNIWGYVPESMLAVREQAGALPVFRQTAQEAVRPSQP